MFGKCKANCQANDILYIRGNVFYYLSELPRQDFSGAMSDKTRINAQNSIREQRNLYF